MTVTGDAGNGGPPTPVPSRGHRLHWFAGRTNEVLDELGEPVVWAMTPAEQTETVAELAALEARVRARLLVLLAEAERGDVAATTGAVDTAAWVRQVTGLTGVESTRLVKQALAL